MHEAGHGAAEGIKHVFGAHHDTGIEAVDNSALGQQAVDNLVGGTGKLIDQHVVKPLLGSISRQHAPVDSTAIVPDEMRNLMNQIDQGSGDRLRASVEQQQKNIDSDSDKENKVTHIVAHKLIDEGAKKLGVTGAGVAAGAAASTALVAAGVATGGAAIAGAAVTAAVGVGIAAGTGAALGAFDGARKSAHKQMDKVEVPHMTQLRQAHQNGTPLSEVPTEKMSLFFTHHQEKTKTPPQIQAKEPQTADTSAATPAA
jgi:hypothetical protein